MAAKERNGSRPGKLRPDSRRAGPAIGTAVSVAINRGFRIGREVLVGRVPGIVVGYNIASFGRYLGSAYPLVIRTALGVTKCTMDEVSLA